MNSLRSSWGEQRIEVAKILWGLVVQFLFSPSLTSAAAPAPSCCGCPGSAWCRPCRAGRCTRCWRATASSPAACAARPKASCGAAPRPSCGCHPGEVSGGSWKAGEGTDQEVHLRIEKSSWLFHLTYVIVLSAFGFDIAGFVFITKRLQLQRKLYLRRASLIVEYKNYIRI